MIDADTLHPLETILRTFTYKPGWEFRLTIDERFLNLRIVVMVIDADCPSSTIRIEFNTSFDHHLCNLGHYPWEKWLRDRILEVERHEVDEFFQIDGVKTFDPHTPATSRWDRQAA